MISKTKQTPESKEQSQHWYTGIRRDCFICIELQHWQCLQLALSERKKRQTHCSGYNVCKLAHLTNSSNCLPFPAPEFTPGFEWGSCYSIFSFMCMFCRSLFVLLYFFFWPLCCLFFFDIRFLIAPLVSSNSSSSHTLLQTVQKFYNYSVKLEVKKIKVYIKRSSITLNWL